MTPDLDTLLTALYVEIDDHVIPSARRRPGQPKRLSDAELACLAVAQVLLGAAPRTLSRPASVTRCHSADGTISGMTPDPALTGPACRTPRREARAASSGGTGPSR